MVRRYRNKVSRVTLRARRRRMYRKKIKGKKARLNYAVKRIMWKKTELKWTVSTANFVITGNAGNRNIVSYSVAAMNPIAQGDGSAERIGNVIELKKSRFRWFIAKAYIGSTTACHVRIIGFQARLFSDDTEAVGAMDAAFVGGTDIEDVMQTPPYTKINIWYDTGLMCLDGNKQHYQGEAIIPSRKVRYSADGETALDDRNFFIYVIYRPGANGETLTVNYDRYTSFKDT